MKPEWKPGVWKCGWLTDGDVHQVVSPNFDQRPAGERICLIVVHAISLPPDLFGGPGVEQLFTNQLNPDDDAYYAQIQGLRVSAHFFIRRDGKVLQFVSTNDRAWHAGASCWRGRSRCNDFSIGIELEGCDVVSFEPIQYARLADLTLVLQQQHPIQALTGHSDIAPGRKTDPGPYFDWKGLRLRLGESLETPIDMVS